MLVQRYKAIEYAEKRIAHMEKDETAMQHWNVARHFELIPKDEDKGIPGQANFERSFWCTEIRRK